MGRVVGPVHQKVAPVGMLGVGRAWRRRSGCAPGGHTVRRWTRPWKIAGSDLRIQENDIVFIQRIKNENYKDDDDNNDDGDDDDDMSN